MHYARYRAFPKLSRAFNGWSCTRALLRDVPVADYDVVLSYWMYPDCFGALGWARRHGLPVVCGTRGSDLLVPDWLTNWQTRRAVSGADRVLAVSRQLAKMACSRYGAPASRVAVIPNGCDTSLFRPADRAAARTALAVAPDSELIVYVGRLVFDKGLRELVEAAAGLTGTRPRLAVSLVGEGPMRAELEQLIARLHAPVRLIGPADPVSVARWMTAANLVSLPSYSEGNPNVVLEALSCGRAVVATRVPGVMEVTAEDTAVLVEPHDSRALQLGLDEALNRRWDEAGIASRHSRSWAQVAAETLIECGRVVAALRAAG
jgi:glycosyltransferase involved in cell wall biosynthesis